VGNPSSIDSPTDSPPGASYADDPAAGIYWGPPTQPKGEPIRWSRP